MDILGLLVARPAVRRLLLPELAAGEAKVRAGLGDAGHLRPGRRARALKVVRVVAALRLVKAFT